MQSVPEFKYFCTRLACRQSCSVYLCIRLANIETTNAMSGRTVFARFSSDPTISQYEHFWFPFCSSFSTPMTCPYPIWVQIYFPFWTLNFLANSWIMGRLWMQTFFSFLSMTISKSFLGLLAYLMSTSSLRLLTTSLAASNGRLATNQSSTYTSTTMRCSSCPL